MNRRVLLLASLAALGGCATAPPAVRIVAPAGAPLPELEPLQRIEAGRDALTIRVTSNGCTTKADFTFYLERKGEAVTLAFGRRKLDACRAAAPQNVDLTFTWAELGVAPRTPVFLLNPVLGGAGS
jgi:hypothetical protein